MEEEEDTKTKVPVEMPVKRTAKKTVTKDIEVTSTKSTPEKKEEILARKRLARNAEIAELKRVAAIKLEEKKQSIEDLKDKIVIESPITDWVIAKEGDDSLTFRRALKKFEDLKYHFAGLSNEDARLAIPSASHSGIWLGFGFFQAEGLEMTEIYSVGLLLKRVNTAIHMPGEHNGYKEMEEGLRLFNKVRPRIPLKGTVDDILKAVEAPEVAQKVAKTFERRWLDYMMAQHSLWGNNTDKKTHAKEVFADRGYEIEDLIYNQESNQDLAFLARDGAWAIGPNWCHHYAPPEREQIQVTPYISPIMWEDFNSFSIKNALVASSECLEQRDDGTSCQRSKRIIMFENAAMPISAMPSTNSYWPIAENSEGTFTPAIQTLR